MLDDAIFSVDSIFRDSPNQKIMRYSLRKPSTFGDNNTGFPRRETSGSVAKCRLFSQAKRGRD